MIFSIIFTYIVIGTIVSIVSSFQDGIKYFIIAVGTCINISFLAFFPINENSPFLKLFYYEFQYEKDGITFLKTVIAGLTGNPIMIFKSLFDAVNKKTEIRRRDNYNTILFFTIILTLYIILNEENISLLFFLKNTLFWLPNFYHWLFT